MAQAGRDNKYLQGEIPPNVSDLSLQFLVLPQKEIVKIFSNKLKPINFYQLRYMKSLIFEAY